MNLVIAASRRSRTLIGHCVSAVLAACLAPSALAQDSAASSASEPPPALEEIVVSGIRVSLESAIAQKRDTDNIIEVINAEDVGKMPDQNLAEVLENITGVQIDRRQGVGAGVWIRGTDQNRVEINGRGTTPATDARGGISFEDLPSELIAAVNVVKVPTADMVEGSLGGTVDLKTYRPLKLRKPIRSLSYRNEYAENRDSRTDSYSGTYGDNFGTGIGDMGFVLGATLSAEDVREDSLNVRIGPRNNVDLDGDGVNDPYLRPQFAQQYYDSSDRETKAFNGSFEWQATDSLRLFVDGTYVDADIENTGVYTALGQQGRAELDHLDTAEFRNYKAPSGVVIPIIVKSQVDGIQIRSANSSSSRYTKSSVYAAGGEWQRGDWKVTAEYSAAKSETDAPNFQLNTQFQRLGAANPGAGASQQLVNFMYDAKGPLEYGPLDPTQFDYLNTDAYAMFVVRDRADFYENTDDAQRIDVEYQVGNSFLRSVQFGLRNSSGESRRDGFTRSSTPTFPGIYGDALAPFMAATPGDLMDFKSGGYYLRDYLAPNARLLRGQATIRELRDLVNLPVDNELQPTRSFRVDEDTLAGYLRLNFDMQWGSWPVRGNVGLRVVETEQTARGLQIGPGTTPEIVPINAKQTYTESLPSLSLVVVPMDDLLVRFGAARILRRPDFGDLSPTVNFPANNNAVEQGNPELEPTTADQYDLSFEYYFRKGSLLSVGAFYKDINGTIGTETLFDAIFNPYATNPDGTQGALVNVIRPVNVEGGKIKGVEISLQHSLDYLDGFWSGFGGIINYTYQDGERDVVFNIPGFLQNGGPAQFPLNFQGLSEESYNLTLYYETKRFDARVRYTYRDGFLRNESRDLSNGFPFYQTDRGQLNANLSFRFLDHYTLTLSGINLTKERYDESAYFVDGPVVQMRDADRRVLLGLRASF